MAKKAKSMAEMLSLPSYTSMFTLTTKPRKKPKRPSRGKGSGKYEVTYTQRTGGVFNFVDEKIRRIVPQKFDSKLAAWTYTRSINADYPGARNPRIRRVK